MSSKMMMAGDAGQTVPVNRPEQPMHNRRRHVLRNLLIILLVLVILVAGLVLFLTATEYRPEAEEPLEVEHPGGVAPARGVRQGSTLSLVTWNVGYGALGDNADFFMDGGKHVYTADRKRVQENVESIEEELNLLDPDFVFLQETDVDSARSFHINEKEGIANALAASTDRGLASSFAYNFSVPFIPYPVPPIGKVESGIETLSRYDIAGSTRIQLPCPFQWPVRVANLKRCLMVDRMPVVDASGKETGRDLVLVNLHLEAYDSGEGKTAQTKMLKDVLDAEAAKGNYVIAGGDFNQTFSGIDDSRYPEYEGRWHCGEIDESDFDDSWQFLMDNAVPSCRSLDQSYAGKDDATFQFYLIDGFIVSDNIRVDAVQTQDLRFAHSDHNPVELRFGLQ